MFIDRADRLRAIKERESTSCVPWNEKALAEEATKTKVEKLFMVQTGTRKKSTSGSPGSHRAKIPSRRHGSMPWLVFFDGKNAVTR
jgi:hypothetical protein